jgi:hypothetical protein
VRRFKVTYGRRRHRGGGGGYEKQGNQRRMRIKNLFSAGLCALPASLALLIAILHLRYLEIAWGNSGNNGESDGVRSSKRVAVTYDDANYREDSGQRQWVMRGARVHASYLRLLQARTPPICPPEKGVPVPRYFSLHFLKWKYFLSKGCERSEQKIWRKGGGEGRRRSKTHV